MNKHLLRGFGIGVLFATIVLFFINKPKPITDEEIVNKAKALGMITNEELTERLSEERLAAIRDSLNAENTEDKAEPEPSPAPVDIPVTDETDYEPVTVDTPVEDLDPEEEDHDHEDEEPTESVDDKAEDTTEEPSKDAEGPVEGPVEEEPEPVEEPIEEPVEEEPSYVTLRITRGMSSEKVSSALFAAGLIESASDFNSYLVRNGKASIINVGEYKISYDADYEEIARLITE